MNRMKELEEEKLRLKKMYAKSGLKIKLPRTLFQNSGEASLQRDLACRAKLEYDISIRIACDVLSICTTCYFYKPILSDENTEIEDWLNRLTRTHKYCAPFSL